MGQWKNGQLVQINGQLFRIRKKTKFGLFNDHKCLDCLALPHPVDARVCTKCLQKCAQHCYPVPFNMPEKVQRVEECLDLPNIYQR